MQRESQEPKEFGKQYLSVKMLMLTLAAVLGHADYCASCGDVAASVLGVTTIAEPFVSVQS